LFQKATTRSEKKKHIEHIGHVEHIQHVEHIELYANNQSTRWDSGSGDETTP
jgi:hypothetical protein